MASDDDPPSILAFPADEWVEDALWLVELIRGLRMFAEGAGHPEVVTILDEARAAAQAAAGIPSDGSLN